MTASAREIATALGGRRAQRLGDGSFLVPCPVPSHGKGRGDRSPSLRIGDGQTRLLVKCYAGCDPRNVLAELRRRGLLDGERPAPRRGGDPLELWYEAPDAHGTPVETYLANRPGGLTLPPGANVLRYHPACPFAGSKTPAMVALVRNIETNEPQAIHRTALDTSGRKIEIDGKDKMALGPISGGAIKLTANENVTIALGIAEGIETALSLQLLPEWAGSPVWSVISASGIAKFPLLPGIETLVIGCDHDPAGEKATLEVLERWQERETFVFKAREHGADLNDVLERSAS
jgi:putative DNA primase/helicase